MRMLKPVQVWLTALAVCAGACSDSEGPRSAPGIAVAEALGDAGDSGGYARAFEPPQLEFPRDHGPHPEFRTEWWYLTGNVDSADGRRFGVLLVFFRQALAPHVPEREATLAARDMVLAHAAVSDLDGERFHFAERLSRAAAGLGVVKGGADQPLELVCADWSMRAEAGGDGLLPLALAAQDRDFAFRLRATPGKPLVLQGERGLSRKSDAPGNASIYYSLTRLALAGTVVVDGRSHEVEGLGWIDREWSTSALGPDQVGWDWFSLQLDDGSDLMWYRLRRRDGTADPWSRGLLVDRDGTGTTLDPAEVQVEPRGAWTSPDGLATYPAAFRLIGTSPSFDLEVTPLLADQELHTLVRYWEGAVGVRGTRAGRPVTGRGYLEMTGYTRSGDDADAQRRNTK